MIRIPAHRTPTHPGEMLLEEFLRPMDLTQRELADAIYTARLETGIHQHEAIDLYKRLGYSEIAPFGEYTEDPLSVFMEKKIG